MRKKTIECLLRIYNVPGADDCIQKYSQFDLQRFSVTCVVIWFPVPFFWWQPDFLSSQGAGGLSVVVPMTSQSGTPLRSSILLVQLMGSDEVHTPMTDLSLFFRFVWFSALRQGLTPQARLSLNQQSRLSLLSTGIPDLSHWPASPPKLLLSLINYLLYILQTGSPDSHREQVLSLAWDQTSFL